MPGEKSGRREQILEAAAELWQKNSFADFKMVDLAGQTGLAKGTLYLYFSTKEQLFLQLLEERLFAWMGRLKGRFSELDDASPRVIARLVREAFEADPPLDRLLPLLESVLEHGIGKEQAVEFKRRLASEMADLAAALESAMPDMEKGQGVEALILTRALHGGFRQMADISPVLQQVFDEDPGLAPLRVDFARDFENALANALRGLTRKKGRKK